VHACVCASVCLCHLFIQHLYVRVCVSVIQHQSQQQDVSYSKI